MKRGILFVVAFGSIAGLPAWGGTLYSHSFGDLHDIALGEGSATLQSVAAPGGKPGTALMMANAAGGTSYASLTPSGVGAFPNAVTTVFRFYIDQRTDFMAMYNYAPGEGLRFVAGGGFQGSSGESLSGSWAEDTWYTAAMVLNSPGNIDAYVKQGADAQLAAGDSIGTIGGAGRPMNHSTFFDYGGTIYFADYTINEGMDFTVIPEPATLSLLSLAGLAAMRRRRP